MHLTVVLDCTDLDRLAEFWKAAIGYGEVARDDRYIGLRALDGSRPTLVLQRVPEPKTVKNRMHLDVFADDFEADLARLQGLGATVLVPPHIEEGDEGMRLVVLADPEGNEFCLLAPVTPAKAPAPPARGDT